MVVTSFIQSSPLSIYLTPRARLHLHFVGPVLPTPPSLHGCPVRTCMGTLSCWEPMWQYPIKITNIQVDIAQVDWWSSFTCQRSLMAYVTGYFHIGSQRGRVPTQVRAGSPHSERAMGGAGPNRMKMWSSPRHTSPRSVTIGKNRQLVADEPVEFEK